jgi:hypothetical protein
MQYLLLRSRYLLHRPPKAATPWGDITLQDYSLVVTLSA